LRRFDAFGARPLSACCRADEALIDFPDTQKAERINPLIAFVQPEQLPYATEGMLKRGYAEADVRGILGENYLRVAAAVWR
jgi:microsomal dipeptidase-like Zn-dependent dipeptidase|tara:strand:- start:504 stop:746 length:243 start_codon:yes stop_codon:yes gene_type:complete